MSGHYTSLLALTRFGWGLEPNQLASSQEIEGPALLTNQVKQGLDGGWELSQSNEQVFSQQDVLLSARKKKGGEKEVAMAGREMVEATRKAESNRLRYAASTKAPFLDRLSMFWANHFAISGKTRLMQGLAPDYELNIIRPRILGSFSDMLMSVVAAPAMLLYLDNNRSFGPNSKVGKRRGVGLNENLAREVLELHTLGADKGYSQADVTAFAKCLTGWTVDYAARQGPTGAFYFNPNWHEPGPQTVLGKTRTSAGIEQAQSVLRDISVHPSTARNIARKLARHFVSDDPPKSLVAKLEKRFLDTGGDLREVSLELIRAEESWTEKRSRFTPPLAFVVALDKALPKAVAPVQLLAALKQMGQPLWAPNSPEGYPDDNASWLSANAMKLRLNLVDSVAAKADIGNNVSDFARKLFGDTLSAETAKTISRAESSRQGLTLLLMSPEFQRR